MPRYFFDLKRGSGDLEADSDGVPLANQHAAEKEALRAVGELIRDLMAHGRLDNLLMQVRDETGEPVAETSVSVQHRLLSRS